MSSNDSENFFCSQCGQCCRNLNNRLYDDLNRGDGVCKFLNGSLCSIYNDRPLKCRVDEMYQNYFSENLSKGEYYKLNKLACAKLQKNIGGN